MKVRIYKTEKETPKMRKKRVYISGRISNTEDYLARFATCETRLKSKGYEVINPAKVCSELPQLEWQEYMRVCLAMLKLCDVLYMMKGWVLSDGAWVEYNKATEWGIKIIDNEIY